MKKKWVVYSLIIVFLLSIACIGSLRLFYKNLTLKTNTAKKNNTYFVPVPIVNWVADRFPTPCISIKIGDQTICSSLDLGFRGFFSIEEQILDKIEDKMFVGTLKRYGFRGVEYEKEVFEIPKIQIGCLTFYRIPVQKEAEEFRKNSTISNSVESSSIDLGRMGWETCKLGGNLLLDLQNNILAFCDSADTLKKRGYALESFAKSQLFSDRGFLELMANTEKGPLRCVLDTGATYNCLHTELAEGQSFDDMISSFDNIYKIQHFQIENQELGPFSFHKIPIQLPIQVGAFLGMEFFLKHVVFINFKDNLIYIQQHAPQSADSLTL